MNWLGTVLRVSAWTFLAVIVLAVSLVLGPPGILLAGLVIGLVIRLVIVSRTNLAMIVFSTIGASMRQNLPLPTAIQAESQGTKGRLRLTLHRIADWLAQGFSFSESLRRGYPQCPGYAIALTAAAEQVQQTPQAVAAVEAHLIQQSVESRKIQPVNPVYPLVVLAAAMFVLYGLMAFVIPSYESIFDEVGYSLPRITQAVIAIARTHKTPLVFVLMMALLAAIPTAVYLRLRPRRPAQPYLLSQMGDAIKWRLPVLHWFERNYALFHTVCFLRLALHAGATLDEAIAGAAQLDVNLFYRRRLQDWHQRVTRGQDIAAAAKQSRVGPALAWAFDSKVNPNNAPAILESLETSYRSNYSYTVNLARFAFWPCVTLFLAAVVGTIAYAMFAPLVALIQHAVQGALP